MAYAKKKAAAKAEMERKLHGGKAVKNTPKKMGAGWASVKKKMNIPTPTYIDPKQTEMEFRSAVFKMMKSENSLVMMEEARKKKKVVREKTEFEIVKERLKHIEFSDEEKGFLTPEQMELVKRGVMLAKDELAELERDAKGSGQSFDMYILKYPSWTIEIRELNEMEVTIDLSNLLQARKRAIIRKLFYDPQADEKRRLAEEERERQRLQREAELEAARSKEEEERLRLLEEEKERLRKARELSEAELREAEEERRRLLQEEEDKLNQYAASMNDKQAELDAIRLAAEREAQNNRAKKMRKFSTVTDAPDLADLDPRGVGKLNYQMPGSEFSKDLNNVGKLDNPFANQTAASRRKSVGKLSNPFDGANPSGKPKSRRMSKVGKLNSPFEQSLAEGQEVRSFSRSSSRRSSISSRRDSLCDSEVSEEAEGVSSAFLLEMNSAMQGLADLAAKASNDDDQWGKSNNSSNNSDEE